jgi:hypothetical protein
MLSVVAPLCLPISMDLLLQMANQNMIKRFCPGCEVLSKKLERFLFQLFKIFASEVCAYSS